MSKQSSLTGQIVLFSGSVQNNRHITNVRKLKQGITPPALIIPVIRAIPKPMAPERLGGNNGKSNGPAKNKELIIVKPPKSAEGTKAIVVVHDKVTDSNNMMVELMKTVNRYGKNFEDAKMVYQICAIGETKMGGSTTICNAITFDNKSIVWVEMDLFQEQREENEDDTKIEDIEKMCDYVFDHDQEEVKRVLALNEEDEDLFLNTENDFRDALDDNDEVVNILMEEVNALKKKQEAEKEGEKKKKKNKGRLIKSDE